MHLIVTISIWDGAFGRAADHINTSLELCASCVLEKREDGAGLQGVFKNMGDFCVLIRLVPGYVQFVRAETLNLVVEACKVYLDGKDGGLEKIGKKDNVTVDMVLEVGISAYTAALVICREENNITHFDVSDIVAAYLHDIALSCFWRYQLIGNRELLDKAISNIKSALSVFPSSAAFWNSLAVIAMEVDAGLAQHAFIRALEFDEKVFILLLMF